MIETAQNKDMNNVAKKENKNLLQEFFFPGGGTHLPQTVTAETIEKAEEIYHKTKVKVINNNNNKQ